MTGHPCHPFSLTRHAAARWAERFSAHASVGAAYLRAVPVEALLSGERRLHDPATGALFCVRPAFGRPGWDVTTVLVYAEFLQRGRRPATQGA